MFLFNAVTEKQRRSEMTGLTSFAVNTSTLDFTGINLRGAAPPTYSYLASWKLSVRDAKSSTENGLDPSSDCRS